MFASYEPSMVLTVIFTLCELAWILLVASLKHLQVLFSSIINAYTKKKQIKLHQTDFELKHVSVPEH